MNKDTIKFDEGKVAQMSAAFAITIFLSLTILFAKQKPEYSFLVKLLWAASGFFCAASMRLLDRIFDHNKDFKVILSVLQVKGRSFMSFDERWMDGRFALYFIGWCFFISAFFYVGILIFLQDTPQSFYQYLSLLFSDLWLGVGFVIMAGVTLSSITREFFFTN